MADAVAEDMEKLTTEEVVGVETPAPKAKPKHQCKGCEREIKGTLTKANDHEWHPDCFVCTTCRRAFADGFIVEHKQVFCDDNCLDKYDLIKDPADTNSCWGCRGKLGAVIIKVKGDVRFHEGCFNCRTCLDNLLDKDGYIWEVMNPFCNDECAKNGVCFDCKKVLTHDTVTAMNKKWHAACFCCAECGSDFADGNFHTVASRPNKPFCENCIEAQRTLKFK